MNFNFLKKKDDQRYPDSYMMQFHFIDGKWEEYEVASHAYINGSLVEIVTTDDLWHMIPFSGLKRIAFDKNFSKSVALNKEKKLKNEKKIDVKSTE